MTKGYGSRGGVLSTKEDDWNLVGANCLPCTTRTRFAGEGRPNLVKTVVNEEKYDTESIDTDEDWVEGEEEEEEDDDDDLDDQVKPDATRVIVEAAALQDVFASIAFVPTVKVPWISRPRQFA
jgi:hypothetical protein